MHQRNRDGFTLVEAVIVLILLVVVMAAAYVAIREYERSRLQALADASPDRTFDFRVWPESDSYPWNEDVVLFLEVRNSTAYRLKFSWKVYSLLYDVDRLRSAYGSDGGESRTRAAEMAYLKPNDVRLTFSTSATGAEQIPSDGVLIYRATFSLEDSLDPKVPASMGELEGVLGISRPGSSYWMQMPSVPFDAP